MKKKTLQIKAFEYAVRGYSVMPLRRNKQPQLPSWKEFQTEAAGEEQIAAWWKKFPDANVGILTGQISGISVVDIDTHGGKGVPLDTFPATFTVKTPTGGYHLYYKYDARIKQGSNAFPQFPHVDIRNDGGYVVAPPSFCEYEKDSKRIKGTYKVERAVAVAPFPFALFGVAKATSTHDKPLSTTQVLKGFDAMQEGDGRNVALTKVAGRILRIVPMREWEEVGRTLLFSANERFKKPLPKKEVDACFDSIMQNEAKKPGRDIDLLSTDKGEPIINDENVYRIMKGDPHLENCARFNIFEGVVEIGFQEEFHVYQRIDVIKVRAYIMRTYPFLSRVGHQSVEDVLIRIAGENRVSPPADWLRKLVWDKQPRLDTMLTSLFGVQDNVYHRAVISNWMKGLVSRIIYPGCKFDYVLVLEGRQGLRKSTSLAVLGGGWHVETVLAPDNKDFFMILAGKAIVEFSEGETLSRTEAKRLKAIITIQHDKYRVPYERAAQDFPRQCVFAMTTNQDQYLKDETGNRRWLPVAVEKPADIEWLTANREQIFAEAFERAIIGKEKTYEFPEEETLREQQKRQIGDPRDELLHEWYFTALSETDREEGITTHQAYTQGILKGQAFGREMSRQDSIIIGSILRDTFHMERRRKREGDNLSWRYFSTAETEKLRPKKEDYTQGMKANEEFNGYGKQSR